ncbi:hypothetical protein HanRHA438_Chr10g0457711 [Helianthus annuus]|nr:hypothetical protein HanRHA438_Chr10g0457711 [Helianthus annuus]
MILCLGMTLYLLAVVAPLVPDLIPAAAGHAPFADRIDPRYAFTRNGWIEDDDDLPSFVEPVTPPPAPTHAPVDIAPFHPHVSDIHRTDLPITFLQDIPLPRPREGPSSQPSGPFHLCQQLFPSCLSLHILLLLLLHHRASH